jgi:Holliday junction resolvase RusA-like endonuclease
MAQLLPFEFIVRGTPVSFQARNRSNLRSWKYRVERSARRAWPAGEPPVSGEVTVVITYFYRDKAPDIDNIVKPIQDTLISLVYHDDEQVTQSTVRKSPIDRRFDLTTASLQLVSELGRGQDFLLVKILPAPIHEGIL